MLAGLRREIEPVSAADFLRFMFGWQHVRPGSQLHGQPGLARVIAELQGFEAAAGAWEREILPARIAGYDPAWLDALCLSGGVGWGRLGARPAGGTPSRAAPIALVRRADLPWLLAPEAGRRPKTEGAVGAGARRARLPGAGRRELPRRNHRAERAGCGRRSKTRWASWSPRGG